MDKMRYVLLLGLILNAGLAHAQPDRFIRDFRSMDDMRLEFAASYKPLIAAAKASSGSGGAPGKKEAAAATTALSGGASAAPPAAAAKAAPAPAAAGALHVFSAGNLFLPTLR
ncbi:MAG: hypothetical protein J0G29_02380 [Alphaproteobacteria bacterium]|nr:hypothetical protein [Alphaproteobacteria bacterium]OJV45463.1 MAG: hypothetical protein BGO28_05040 [Alphaproteobacteria bacterium 43-37]